jgi:hypothetical protein
MTSFFASAALIGKWWKANRYSADEIRNALTAAGFAQVNCKKFPMTYFWQNHRAHVVEALPKPNI